MNILARIARALVPGTRQPAPPRVLFAISRGPGVTLDSMVPQQCRIPIMYEANGEAAPDAPLICANPRDEYYANPAGRAGAINFVQAIKRQRPVATVILYGSPATQWGRWDNPQQRGYARAEVSAHVYVAGETGCAWGPSMYTMDANDRGRFDKHRANIELITYAIERWRETYPNATPPSVFPFVSPFVAGRCEPGTLVQVKSDETVRLLDSLLAKGWTPVVWAHAYSDDAMLQIRNAIYPLTEYMR